MFFTAFAGSTIEDSPFLASLEGGLLLEPRTRCAKESSVLDGVSGFILEGFHSYSKESELFWDDSSRLTVLQNTLSCLPLDKVRVVSGALHPISILTLVKAGIDLFDTSYTYQVTERGGALCFPYSNEGRSSPPADRMFELDLTDGKYADQFIPLLEKCTCHTCKGFTRGYIHHLLNTREMLAPVLLSIHNIHHYLRFFEQLRRYIASSDEGSLDEFERIIRQSRGPDIVYSTDTPPKSPTSSING